MNNVYYIQIHFFTQKSIFLKLLNSYSWKYSSKNSNILKKNCIVNIAIKIYDFYIKMVFL